MAARKERRFKKRHVIYLILLGLCLYLIYRNISFTDYVMKPTEQELKEHAGNTGVYQSVPLDPLSPWPKFRANALQNGRTPVEAIQSDLAPWRFKTGKGIFSSPVVDQDGTLYIGSADQYFYAIDLQGKVKWKTLTGEIIDSSALLDNQKRVYVGSGDAFVYAMDRENGEVLWKFKAHTPEEVTEKFGVQTYNLNWFEGNIAMLGDGSILAPNDNYLVYRINRETGELVDQYVMNEMGWSLPAVNPVTNKIFTGSNFMALKNVFSFDIETGETEWTNGGYGTNAASAMLTSSHSDGAVVIGGYDGFVRAFAQDDGFQIWKFGVRDHIYSSPAQLVDGTIIQPSTDGTVYALNPEDGSLKWAFDTLEPIRSSPAVDSKGRIYFGSGDGKLYCLNPNGTLRWAYQLIHEVRNDLNGSPALGNFGVYIAGESGEIFFVPYDYPITEKGKKDPSTLVQENENLPSEGSYLVYTTPFGKMDQIAPPEIDANQPLSFTLFVRENGDTVKTAIDRDSLEVNIVGGDLGRVDTAANHQYLTLIPHETWTGEKGGEVRISIKGDYDRDLSRFGLKFFWGKDSGSFNETFTFRVKPRKKGKMPYHVPEKPGDLSSTIEISRLAPANPSILPSYNQIGYDSLHYIFGMVEGKGNSAIVWGVGGKLLGESGETVVDPNLEVRFPMMVNYDSGLLTLYNYDGILLDMNGSWDMPIEFFRIAGRVDPASGVTAGYMSMNAVVDCDQIEFYGNFLKLLGMSEFDTGRMFIYGGANYSLFGNATTRGPEFNGSVSFSVNERKVKALIKGSQLMKKDYVHSLLLVDEASGRPVSAKYIDNTQVTVNSSGMVSEVTLILDEIDYQGKARAYYMVNTYPVAQGSVSID